eukprot:4872208-Amphidinium_carterae.1
MSEHEQRVLHRDVVETFCYVQLQEVPRFLSPSLHVAERFDAQGRFKAAPSGTCPMLTWQQTRIHPVDKRL